MNNKQLWTLLTVCTFLSACADPAFDEAIAISDEYADVAMVNYSDSSGLWRIHDRPDENRMKIGPSLARSLGGAFGPDVTFVPPTMGETQRTAQSCARNRMALRWRVLGRGRVQRQSSVSLFRSFRDPGFAPSKCCGSAIL